MWTLNRALGALGGLAILLSSLLGTQGCDNRKQVWIYTSIYKEVLAELDPMLKTAFPDLDIRFFQGGSENVAAKVNTELVAGRTQADLILTSDPFWYQELKGNHRLQPYDSPAAKAVPAGFRDPENAFTAVRIPVMVMGYHPEIFATEELPKTWKELAEAKWKGQLSMGNPHESGTMFTTVALLSRHLGWDYFAELRKGEILAAGGNGSVINRIETKERPIGVVLLENILKARAKKSPVQPIYPTDGAIPVPSPIAIMKGTKNLEAAQKIYDWFYSKPAQEAIVKSGMYSPIPGFAPPPGGRPWSELQGKMMEWSPELLAELYKSRQLIKAKFSEVVFK